MKIARSVLVALSLFVTSSCADGKRLSEFLTPVDLEDDGGPNSAKRLRGDFKRDEFPKDATFQGTMYASANDLDNNEKAKRFLKAGITLSNDLCRQFFQNLIRVQVKISADRDMISNVGALSAVLLGFADIKSEIVGGIAGGFGFIEDAYSTEQANFLVAADLSLVQEMIGVERKSKALSMLELEYDFHRAAAALIEYNDTCTQGAIKRSVNNAVENVKFQHVSRLKKGQEALFGLATITVNNEMADIFAGSPKVTTNTLIYLHGLLNAQNVPQEAKEVFQAGLRETKIILQDGSLNFKPGQDVGDVRKLLFRANINGMLDNGVTQIVKDVQKAQQTLQPEPQANPPAAAPVPPVQIIPNIQNPLQPGSTPPTGKPN